MKIIKNNFKLILGIILGTVFASCGAYAATTYAISSNKVSYTDNSSLGVDNVQAAIDGTCSNIDNRLAEIEGDKKAAAYVGVGTDVTVTLNDANQHIMTNYTSYRSTNSNILSAGSTGITIKKNGNYMMTVSGAFNSMSSNLSGNVKRFGIYKNATYLYAATGRVSTWDMLVTPTTYITLKENDLLQVFAQCEGATSTYTCGATYYGLFVVYLGEG